MYTRWIRISNKHIMLVQFYRKETRFFFSASAWAFTKIKSECHSLSWCRTNGEKWWNESISWQVPHDALTVWVENMTFILLSAQQQTNKRKSRINVTANHYANPQRHWFIAISFRLSKRRKVKVTELNGFELSTPKLIYRSKSSAIFIHETMPRRWDKRMNNFEIHLIILLLFVLILLFFQCVGENLFN